MMERKSLYTAAATGGAILFAVGLYLTRALTNPQGIMQALPYVLVGVGAGIFGHYAGELIAHNRLSADPELAENLAIEQGDERSKAIDRFAKAKAYDLMLYLYGGIMLAFALMRVERLVILVMVSGYLAVVGSYVYYQSRFRREM